MEKERGNSDNVGEGRSSPTPITSRDDLRELVRDLARDAAAGANRRHGKLPALITEVLAQRVAERLVDLKGVEYAVEVRELAQSLKQPRILAKEVAKALQALHKKDLRNSRQVVHAYAGTPHTVHFALRIPPAVSVSSVVTARVAVDPESVAPLRTRPSGSTRSWSSKPLFESRRSTLAAVLEPLGTARLVVGVQGAPGVGKSEFVLHLAEALEERFGRVLVATARSYDDHPATPNGVAAQILSQLGLTPALDQSAFALLRDHLPRANCAVTIEDARPEVIRAFLPFASRSTVLVFTARGAVDPDVAWTALHPPPSDEAVEYLLHRSGRRWAFVGDAEMAAVRSIVARLASLPIALECAAANLAFDPTLSATEFAAELDEATHLLGLHLPGDDRTLSALFSSSLDRVSEDARSTFRRLSLFEDPFSRDAAMRVGGCATSAPLRDLVAVGLLSWHADGAYAMHDLVRLFARTQQQERPDEERREDLTRAARYILAAAKQHRSLAPEERARRTWPASTASGVVAQLLDVSAEFRGLLLELASTMIVYGHTVTFPNFDPSVYARLLRFAADNIEAPELSAGVAHVYFEQLWSILRQDSPLNEEYVQRKIDLAERARDAADEREDIRLAVRARLFLCAYRWQIGSVPDVVEAFGDLRRAKNGLDAGHLVQLFDAHLLQGDVSVARETFGDFVALLSTTRGPRDIDPRVHAVSALLAARLLFAERDWAASRAMASAAAKRLNLRTALAELEEIWDYAGENSLRRAKVEARAIAWRCDLRMGVRPTPPAALSFDPTIHHASTAILPALAFAESGRWDRAAPYIEHLVTTNGWGVSFRASQAAALELRALAEDMSRARTIWTRLRVMRPGWLSAEPFDAG